ncbi:MAG: hypothetical protein ACFFFG_18205 [Candidatus Thorarchaeota archaeon]
MFSDTGDEHDETYTHLEEMKILCHQNGIELVHLTPDLGYHTRFWPSLRAFYRRTQTCGSKGFKKTCTDNLKIQPIYRFLDAYMGEKYGFKTGLKRGLYQFTRAWGKIQVLIGFSKREEKRIAKTTQRSKWMTENLHFRFPLLDRGMDRQACQSYIRSVGYQIPLPSNCKLCPFISEIELVWLARNYPNDFRDWVKIEAAKIAKFKHRGKQNYGVWPKLYKGQPITLNQVLAQAEAKYGHWTDAQLGEYRMTHGHCVVSKC